MITNIEWWKCDWDEAWTIDVGNDQLIASSNKVACAGAFLKHKGVEE